MLAVFIFISLVTAVLAVNYLYFHEHKRWKWSIDFSKRALLIMVGYLALGIGFGLGHQLHHVSFLVTIQNILFFNLLYLIALIDWEEQIIPNQLILIMFVTRLFFIITEPGHALPSLIGLFIGGGMIVILMIISKNSIGAGDAKMFAMIGFFIGSQHILSVFFYTFLLSAVIGVVLIMMRQIKWRDAIALAPFAFLGTLFDYVVRQIF